MADQDPDSATADTEPMTPSGNADFVLNEFGETVSYLSPLATQPQPAQPQATAAALAMPAAIGRYEIRGLLGRGGFGAVYRGYDRNLDRQVAIKVPRLQLTKAVEELFPQEARKLAQLRHPSIVTVHDVGVHDGVCFIVSEYLEGPNLNQWMQNRTVTWQEAAAITATLADALATAHARSIIHRDVKPANVIMTDRPEGFVPVLVDFGLALSESSFGAVLAQAGRVTGTPNYMSPEQARGEGNRIDGRTDIYALGVILYRLVSGRLPFTAPDARELLRAVIAHEPRPPRQFVRGLPRELERICLKAMAKNLADRYTTASDLANDLRAVVREHQDQLRLAAATARPRETPAKRDAINILIADDHELSRFKLKTDLEKWGHEVTTAEDGEQAWELFQRHRFAIVITDWMMPKLDGLELVKMIRAADQADYVYIIMLTAKAEKHDIVAGMGAGADDFLVKPFHRDELQVRLRAGIRITKLNRQLNETNRRLERGLEAAAQIQQSFLPTARPQVKGFDFAWGHDLCGKLGGDMFNIVSLGDDRIGIYVLDVTGEGVPAALLATTLSRVLAPASDRTSILVERNDDGSVARMREPVEAAREVNRRFGTQEGRQYFTLAYGVLHLEARRFEFTSAGHPPLLYLQAGRAPTMLDVEGFPIGMAPESDPFQQRAVALQPGDRILIYSDGIPDAMRGDGEVFGAARLLDAVQRFSSESLDGLIGCLMGELRAWRGDAAAHEDASILGFTVS
jgi:sigma-B regulation protein RsbU (phosphoserine phosphatase)